MTTFKWIGIVFAFGVILLVLNLFFGTCNTAVKMQDNAQKVVYDEFKPEVLLQKYEWFKDASAQLDAKLANLKDYEQRLQSMKDTYGDNANHREKWSRSDMDQWNTWQSEMSGVKASYNDLAAQYNAAMAKFNYRFCNKGQLPKGISDTVQREYRPYL